MHSNIQKRPVDEVIEESAKGLTKRLSLVANKKIKLWKALLITVFVAGFASAIVWVSSDGDFTASYAAESSDSEKLILVESSKASSRESWSNSIDGDIRGRNGTTSAKIEYKKVKIGGKDIRQPQEAYAIYQFEDNEIKEVDKVRLLVDTGLRWREKYWLKEFSVQVSMDGQQYTTVLDHVAKQGGGWQEYTFNPVSTKYIKLILNQPSKTCVQLGEFEVYSKVLSSLHASVTNSTLEQNVLAGEVDVLLTNIVLDASESDEDIKVTQFNFIHQTSKAGIQDYITGIILYEGNTQLNVPQSGEVGQTTKAVSIIILSDPLIIAKGTSKIISLKADISASAESGTTHQFIINNDAGIVAFKNSSGGQIKADGDYPLNGILTTVLSAGTLQMSNSSSNPEIGLVLANSTQNVGVFDFKAQGEDIEIENMEFAISGSPNAYQNIDWLQIYDGTTKVGEVQVKGANANLPLSDLIIPQDETKTLTLKAVTHQVGLSESGTSGQNFVVSLIDVDAVGQASGSTEITKTGLEGVVTNAQYIYKTIPVVAKVSLSGLANGIQDLFKFTVSADSFGDIAWHKISFSFETDAQIFNLELYEVQGAGEKLLTNNPVTPSAKTEMYIEADDGYSLVEAGTTRTYLLRGGLIGWNSSAFLLIKLLADTSGNVLEPTSASNVDGNFVWSDLSLGKEGNILSLEHWLNERLVMSSSTQSF